MGGKDSNLRAAKYGYDMVVATTQESINATMKEFLDRRNGEEFVQTYVYKKDETTGQSYCEQADFAKLHEELGFDPFTVPNGTGTDDQKIKKLFEHSFAFAFKAKTGLPDFPLELIPDVITLNQGIPQVSMGIPDFPIELIQDVVTVNQGIPRVSYALFCKTFQIIWCSAGDQGYSEWHNRSQDDDNAPWVFNFYVNLEMRADDLKEAVQLPQTVQDQIRSLPTDTDFSVQQLFLNLNKAELQGVPDNLGLDPDSDVYNSLTRNFLNAYLNSLSPDGRYILGYVVQPKQGRSNQSSLIPTSLDVVISPYVNESGTTTDDYGLYTLDYLVMTNNHPMPAAVPFEWNWIDKSEKTDYHGIMSINRDTFTEYLGNLLSNSLWEIVRHPSVSYKTKLGKITWSAALNPESPNTVRRYLIVKDGGSHILTFHFQEEKKDSDWGIADGDIKLIWDAGSDVYLEGNVIKCITQVSTWFRFNVTLEGQATGWIIRYGTEVCYKLGVDAYGKLTVSLAEGSPKFTNNSENLKFTGLLKLEKGIREALEIMRQRLAYNKNVLTGYDQNILAMLNGTGRWVFPAGRTFSFKDIYFSDHQDLVTHILYAAPA